MREREKKEIFEWSQNAIDENWAKEQVHECTRWKFMHQSCDCISRRVNSVMPLNLLYIRMSRVCVCKYTLCQECVALFFRFNHEYNLICAQYRWHFMPISEAEKNSFRKNMLRHFTDTLYAFYHALYSKLFGCCSLFLSIIFDSIWIFMKFISIRNKSELFLIWIIRSFHSVY